jgi:hypothetical protein
VLGIKQLLELGEDLKAELNDRLTEVLSRLNRSDQLEELFTLLGMSELLHPAPAFESYKNGKIVVIGESDVKEKVLLAIADELGLDKNRFEFCLDYDSTKKFNCKKLQWAPIYSLILVGPMPHSGTVKGDYSSTITALENEDGYPPVERLGTNSLKITKSCFRSKLKEMLLEKQIA